MVKLVRIRACCKCKEYIRLFDDNPISIDTEKAFLKFHPGHPTTIYSGEEAEALKKEYSEFKIQYGGLD